MFEKKYRKNSKNFIPSHENKENIEFVELQITINGKILH